MFRNIVSLLAFLSAFSPGVNRSASADCETEKSIQYLVYKDPTQEDSPVKLVIQMNLLRETQSNNLVGWRINAIQFLILDDEQNPSQSWTDESPEFQTQDGLWWLAHADPCQPVATEFILPPELIGTALADSTEPDDLDYSLAGTDPTSPRPAFFTPTTYLTYRLILANEPEPIEEDEDEPVEPPDSTGNPD